MFNRTTVEYTVLSELTGNSLNSEIDNLEIDNQGISFNGSFETGDFEGWNTFGNANIETIDFGVAPTDGAYQALITNGYDSLTDTELENSLGLSLGTLDSLGNGDATEGSALTKSVTVEAGDVLTFDWDYLTNEGQNAFYNDFGFVAIEGLEDTLANTDSLLNPTNMFDFYLDTGYGTFSYTFDTAGTYDLAIGIMDVGDTWVDSALLIDNLEIDNQGISFNGSFETGDFQGWDTFGNANIETIDFGVAPTDGEYQALITNGEGSVTDTLLEQELGLMVGTLDGLGNGDATEGSALSKSVTAEAGDLLTFDWNYLTNEFQNDYFNDFGFVAIEGLEDTLANTDSLLNYTNAFEFGLETGYGTFSYTFDTAGTYDLAIGIMDVGDTVVDSALLIDNLAVI